MAAAQDRTVVTEYYEAEEWKRRVEYNSFAELLKVFNWCIVTSVLQ